MVGKEKLRGQDHNMHDLATVELVTLKASHTLSNMSCSQVGPATQVKLLT
jgi:hypothetical protein